MIKVGTRVRRKNPFFGKTSDIGEIFEVVYVSDKRIEAAKKTKDRSSVYSFSPDEFSEYFEIIGMEQSKKKVDDKAIFGSLTEGELDYLWYESDSYETFKEMLKLAAKEKANPPKKQCRTWTAWKRWGDDEWYEYSVSRPAGQSAKVKVRTPDGFIGTASCSPDDDFNLAYGVELASVRAEIKNSKDDAARAFDEYLFEKRIVEELKKRLEKVLSRAYGKVEK